MTNKNLALVSLNLLIFIFNYLNSNLLAENRWTRIFGGNHDEQAISVRQTSDDGYMIIATILANNKFSVWLIKTNALGDAVPLSDSLIGSFPPQSC